MKVSGLADLSDERGVLRASIAATLVVASVGIALGLASGSFSIIFDGVYSLVDAGMSVLSLFVVRLITSFAREERLPRRLRERFTMGFWHLEPMVLALNGLLLIGVAVYALINAIGSLLNGGRALEFGPAIVYAVVTVAICSTMAMVERFANRRIRSEFVALDARSWMMSAGITAALLVAFTLGVLVAGTDWAWLQPYVDPAVLAVVCVVIIPIPVGSVRQALSDILLVTPGELKQRVDEVCQRFVADHGFVTYRAYVAKVGRAQEIELYFIVPPGLPPRSVAEWDAIRDEIADAIGPESPDRWLTVVFTEDLEWA